jgi:hypothetical protein
MRGGGQPFNEFLDDLPTVTHEAAISMLELAECGPVPQNGVLSDLAERSRDLAQRLEPPLDHLLKVR